LADNPAVKQAIRGMAAAIKVVVDDPYVSMQTVIVMAAPLAALPDDFDVMDLIGNEAVLALFKEVFSQEIQDAVEAMRKDPVLMDQFAMWANTLPTAYDGVAETLEDTPVIGAYVAVDPDDDPLAVTLTSGPSNGILDITDDGVFTYTPNQDFNGVDSFTYTVSDSIGESNQATVVITVTPVNDAPVLDPIGDWVLTEGMALTFAATASDPDLQDLQPDILTFSLEGTVPAGAVIDPFTGEFNWVPTESQGPATYSLTVRVSDAGIPGPVLTDTALFTVTVFEDGNMDTGPLADDGEPDTYRLRLSGDNIEALLNDTVVFISPLQDAPQLTVTGSTDDDTLIVDLSGGNPIPVESVLFDGGGPGDSDTLIITGGSAATVSHTFTGAGSGTVDLDGSMISYTGLEPIIDQIDAIDRLFTFGNGDDVVFVGDDPTPNDNHSRISSDGSSETVDFRNPAHSLTVNTGGGNDTVSIAQLDPGADGGAIGFAVVVNGESGDLLIDTLNIGSEGELILTSEGSLAGTTPIVASDLTVQAAGDILLTTKVATLSLIIEQSGDATVSEIDDLTLTSVQLFDGVFTLDAESITVTDSVTANVINLTSRGVISATAPGVLIGGDLNASAVGGMNLHTEVEDITAHVTGIGNIVIVETDAVVLSHLSTADGWITVTAGGDITATLIHSITDADVNDITLTTTGSHIQAADLNAGSLGDVFLNSTGPLTATVTADELVTTAAGDMTLYTTVATLTAGTTSVGAVTVAETDTITLRNIQALDGAISITASGTITALNVESLTDAEGNDISLTATSGDILIDHVAVGMGYGGISVVSSGDIRETDVTDPDVDVAGHHADMSAAGEFGSSDDPELNLEMALTMFGFSGEDLIYDFIGDIELNVVASGVVNVTATGTITVTHMESGGGEIAVESTGGDILIGYMDAGADAGTVILTAADSILEAEPADDDVDLIASEANLTAGVTIGGGSDANLYLETAVGVLFAEVSGSTIYLDEVDDIELVAVDAPDGEIVIIAGGNITISGPVTTGAALGYIRLEAAVEVYMTGSDPVTTYLLETVAHSGIFLRTQATELESHLMGSGIMEIREIDGIVLQDVTNADGPIYVIAGGEITAVRVECLTDEKGNNVGLMSLGGDIVVDYVAVGPENCQISLSAAGDIWEADDHDADIDLRGALGILYAEGRIDNNMDCSFKPIGKWGKRYALYEFERGKKLNLAYVRGDVELFATLENKVHVYATGNIEITYLDTNGRDIYLKSKYGDISVIYLNSGPCRGDITLKAAEFIFLARQLYSGNMGQIIAGDDLSIYAGDQIEILGNVSAGDDIKMVSSDGSLSIYGNINSLDDVEIWADDGVIIDASITALDEIEIRTCGYLFTSEYAPLSTGGDIELYGKQEIIIGAAVTAGDDVWIKSEYSDVIIDGEIIAGDRIDVYAGEDLVIIAALTAGNDLDLYAKYDLIAATEAATLTAGVDVELETRYGTIELWGAIHSGNGQKCSPDVLIDSGSEIYIFAAIESLDDVEIWADDGVFIDAPITAADDIEIGTCGSLITTADAVLGAGDDIELYAKKGLSIGAAVHAGDDVDVYSCSAVHIAGNVSAKDDVKVYARSDIEIASTIEAVDRIYLKARENLTLLPGSLLTGMNGEKARIVYLRAGDNMTLDGAINAEKVIDC
jgi:hypothetical protein